MISPSSAKELPFSKEDVKRAFKLLAGENDPEGCITPETLEKSLVSWFPINSTGNFRKQSKTKIQ